MCQNACKSNGNYIFAGTVYQSECWYGNTLLKKVDGSKCNFACIGNLSWICGGNGVANEGAFISLFADSARFTNGSIGGGGSSTTTSVGPAPTGPVADPGNAQFMSVGCYAEPAGGRALSTQVLASDKLLNILVVL